VKAPLNFLLGACFFLKCWFIVPFVPKALLQVASVQRIVFGACFAGRGQPRLPILVALVVCEAHATFAGLFTRLVHPRGTGDVRDHRHSAAAAPVSGAAMSSAKNPLRSSHKKLGDA
jgi:hypothetical protein